MTAHKNIALSNSYTMYEKKEEAGLGKKKPVMSKMEQRNFEQVLDLRQLPIAWFSFAVMKREEGIGRPLKLSPPPLT
jgi:hypothetical protein